LTGAHLAFTFEANYYGIKLDKKNSLGNRLHRRFTLNDMNMMGRSIAAAVFDFETERDLLKSNSWATERLKMLYMKARVSLTAQELAKI
jgi:hypothetical protein